MGKSFNYADVLLIRFYILQSIKVFQLKNCFMPFVNKKEKLTEVLGIYISHKI